MSKPEITEIISQEVELRKVGANFRGLCPFHDDTNPSLVVSPSKQIASCFVCGFSGDVYSFIMKLRGLTFPETAKFLGVDYKPDPVKKAERDAKILKKRQQDERLLFIGGLLAKVPKKKKELADKGAWWRYKYICDLETRLELEWWDLWLHTG